MTSFVVVCLRVCRAVLTTGVKAALWCDRYSDDYLLRAQRIRMEQM
jgi:hypothetical protein